MIQYHPEMMRQVGSLIQSNGEELHRDVQFFWNRFANDTSETWGTFSAFSTCLANFQMGCQDATRMLAANRMNLGSKLMHFATVAAQDEYWIQQDLFAKLKTRGQ
jgi:hypothetical protein